MNFRNAYEDETLAAAYSRLEFPDTYYLAYRDLPGIINEHVTGRRALDFGCGAGRSTRFLRRHGFDTIGIDVSHDMIRRARVIDPDGDYRLVPDGDFSLIGDQVFDLILSAFTFDNVPTRSKKVNTLRSLSRLLASKGRFVNLVSTPDIYVHEWASFSTADFLENRTAKTGDVVRIINTSIEDRRPVEDILWPDDAYRDVYGRAGLEVVEMFRPLAREDEPFQWVNETRIAPWAIYVLERKAE